MTPEEYIQQIRELCKKHVADKNGLLQIEFYLDTVLQKWEPQRAALTCNLMEALNLDIEIKVRNSTTKEAYQHANELLTMQLQYRREKALGYNENGTEAHKKIVRGLFDGHNSVIKEVLFL